MSKPVIEYIGYKHRKVKIVNRNHCLVVAKDDYVGIGISCTNDEKFIEAALYLGEKITEQEFAAAYNEAIQQINLIKEM
jgi:hypothetical protein